MSEYFKAFGNCINIDLNEHFSAVLISTFRMTEHIFHWALTEFLPWKTLTMAKMKRMVEKLNKKVLNFEFEHNDTCMQCITVPLQN